MPETRRRSPRFLCHLCLVGYDEIESLINHLGIEEIVCVMQTCRHLCSYVFMAHKTSRFSLLAALRSRGDETLRLAHKSTPPVLILSLKKIQNSLAVLMSSYQMFLTDKNPVLRQLSQRETRRWFKTVLKSARGMITLDTSTSRFVCHMYDTFESSERLIKMLRGVASPVARRRCAY